MIFDLIERNEIKYNLIFKNMSFKYLERVKFGKYSCFDNRKTFKTIRININRFKRKQKNRTKRGLPKKKKKKRKTKRGLNRKLHRSQIQVNTTPTQTQSVSDYKYTSHSKPVHKSQNSPRVPSEFSLCFRSDSF